MNRRGFKTRHIGLQPRVGREFLQHLGLAVVSVVNYQHRVVLAPLLSGCYVVALNQSKSLPVSAHAVDLDRNDAVFPNATSGIGHCDLRAVPMD